MEMFRGIFPAAITPFTETGALDTDALRKNIKRWNEYGLRGIGGLKYAMTLLGYQAGFPRAPLSSPNEADQQMIKHVLQEANLLTV